METRAPATASDELTSQVVEELYAEALVLADDVRLAFDTSKLDRNGMTAAPEQVALSIEGLRTTTRVMQMLGWLLNQRAYFAGELNHSQLQRHGNLPSDRPSEPEQAAALPEPVRLLIQETERLHARIARLDRQQREPRQAGGTSVSALHKRLELAFGHGPNRRRA